MIDAIGLWREIGEGNFAQRPALFLDRDGVVVADTGYLARPQDMRMIDGAAAAIARCNACDIAVVLVTNQSGIARGYYGWDDFRAVQGALTAALAAGGARLDAVLACGYHGAGHGPLRFPDHPWRKPGPGMILAAGSAMGLDLARSWIVGDQVSDVAAGAAGGLAGGTLLAPDARSGRGAALLGREGFIVRTAASLSDATAFLLESGPLAERSRAAAKAT